MFIQLVRGLLVSRPLFIADMDKLGAIAFLFLSPAQAAVLEGTLQGKTYQQIADETGYSHEHLREVGAMM